MSRALRILDVVALGPAAGPRFERRVLALRARGFDQRVACGPGRHVRSLRAAGIPVHPLPLPRVPDPLGLSVSLARLVALLRRERVDVVHTHGLVCGALGRVAASLAGVPVLVHTMHGIASRRGAPAPWPRWRTAVERWCGAPGVLLTRSQTDLEHALANGIGRPGWCLCIGDGIDLSRIQPVLRARTGSRVVVTCVAPHEPGEGHDALLQAATLLGRRGQRLELWLVGDGPLRRRNEAAARDLGLASVVRFLGQRDDLSGLLAATHVLVSSCGRGPVPRALLEAMATGIPVVATRVPASNEVVRHGADGFLVPPGDVHALTAALAVLLDDAELRERMGWNGRQRALAEFDELGAVRRLGELYEEEFARTHPSSARPAGISHLLARRGAGVAGRAGS